MMPIWMVNTGLGAMDVPSGTIPTVKSQEASTKSIGTLPKYPSASWPSRRPMIRMLLLLITKTQVLRQLMVQRRQTRRCKRVSQPKVVQSLRSSKSLKKRLNCLTSAWHAESLRDHPIRKSHRQKANRRSQLLRIPSRGVHRKSAKVRQRTGQSRRRLLLRKAVRRRSRTILLLLRRKQPLVRVDRQNHAERTIAARRRNRVVSHLCKRA